MFGFLTSSSTTRLYPSPKRLTILGAARHETEWGDHDFCLSRSHLYGQRKRKRERETKRERNEREKERGTEKIETDKEREREKTERRETERRERERW